MKKHRGSKDNANIFSKMTGIGGDVPVYVTKESCDSKLSPVEFKENTTERKRPVPVGARCAATYVSARRTCPDTCLLKEHGCYALTGYTGRLMRRLDAWKGPSNWRLGDMEAGAILYAFKRGVPQDGRYGGRDLRLHVGGDVEDERGARVLAAATAAYKQLGGGTVWTYTRRWREVPRDAWGPIVITASLNNISEWRESTNRGYSRAAIVVSKHKKRTNYMLRGLQVEPCQHDIKGLTCVECRRCLIFTSNYHLTAFAVHGNSKLMARRRIEEAG